MPQISALEFERLPLRVHAFLAGVPLHDVWAVDLPRSRARITLDEFLRVARGCLFTPSTLVRMLIDIRLFHWTARWLGSRAGGSGVGTLRNTSDSRRSFSVAGAGRHAGWPLPRCLPVRKRAAPRADQSDSTRRGAERPR